MGRIVDLFDVKVVDGFVFRCDIVNDLNARLSDIYKVYALYDEMDFTLVDSKSLFELRDKCLDIIKLIRYLRGLSLLVGKSLRYEEQRLQHIVDEIKEYLERRKD